jgi:predicted lipoprotein with Yx(FWY)xxD motif
MLADVKAVAIQLLIGLVVGAVGCGEDDGGETTPATSAAEAEAVASEEKPGHDGAVGQQDDVAKGTEVVLGDSEFGQMLYDENDQAIYVFERDTTEESTCYDECAAAWPPVLASGEPVAGKGVDGSLLGATERRHGQTQITYGGRPLYYYAHEAPGEVRCHNVDLNGGFWWVVGRDGEPLT